MLLKTCEEFDVSPCETRGRFFDNSGRMASTPNELADPDSEINDEAVFSVLQFGAIVPPLSPWKNVHRLASGYRYRGTEIVRPVRLPEPHVSALNPDQQADEVERVLDSILRTQIGEQQDPVLLFSGGVDSGVIASRLVALGYRDSLLINFSFSEDDPESKIAESMADHLGLKFERVFAKKVPCNCLSEPGKLYPQPFGDPSTAPTSDLANSVVEKLTNQNRLIIDGTGADGAFGMTAKINTWRRLNRVPKFMRKAVSFAYAQSLWHRTGRMEYIARILRRSIDMPLLSAILALNPLAGTFYKKDAGGTIDDLLSKWVEGWGGESIVSQVVAADLALTCANTFAQKALPIFESAGHKVLYPFLEVEAVSTALTAIPHWQMDEPKAPLKRSLARHVPNDMVYRPKSGFVDPRQSVYFDDQFVEFLRASFEPSGPIAHLLEKKTLLKSCELLARKKTLPDQTRKLLWTIVFTDRWYRTAFS